MLSNEEKPRILIITRNLPPLVGGMEKLMQNLVDGISNYAELTVIGPHGCAKYLPDDVTTHETSARMLPFLLFSTWLAIRACRKTSFDTVIGGSGLIAPTLKILTLLFQSKTVIFLHGLDIVVDSFVYQRFFLPCIAQTQRVIANSNNTRLLAMNRGVPEKSITVIYPGTNMPDIPNDEALANYRKANGIHFEQVMIFVGRMTKRKGLSAFIQRSLPAILAAEPTAGLVVIGDNPSHSLNKLGEQKEVLTQVERLGTSDRIVFLGQVSDSDLTACYATADVQVFPLIEVRGDVEGFGMIAIEAAACGTPTVAFDLGGVRDSLPSKSDRLVEPGEYSQFSQVVIDTLRTGTPNAGECIDHARNFSWSIFHRKVKNCLLDIIQ